MVTVFRGGLCGTLRTSHASSGPSDGRPEENSPPLGIMETYLSGCSVGAQWRGAGSSGLVDRAQAWTPGWYSRGRIDHSVIHLEPSKDAVISQISCDFDLLILFSNYLLNTCWVQGFDTHFRYKDEQGRGYPCPQVACRLLGKEAPDFMANYLFT